MTTGKHVNVGDRKAACGASVGPFVWMFTSPSHAQAAVQRDTLVQPCARCMRAIARAEQKNGRPPESDPPSKEPA